MMDTEQLEKLLGEATPGPWKAKSSAMADDDIGILGDGGCLAECFSSIRKQFERATDEQAANAALIAMAPDLAATVLRLTAELADTLAANAALVTRLDEAMRLMNRGLWLTDDGPAARAFLAGEGKP